MLTSVSENGSENPSLEQLRRAAVRVAELERELASCRSIRDEEIKRVVEQAGVSERAAAVAADVSPGYAHRAAVNGRFARRVRA